MSYDPFDIARQIDITDLIANKYGIELTLSGRVLFASCPLDENGDSTPSLAVYQGQNRFHCFHCGNWRGTAIDFVMGIDHLSSPFEALTKLNVFYPELHLIDPAQRSRAEKVARYFDYSRKIAEEEHAKLKSSTRYMKWVTDSRGFSEMAIDKFMLGIREYSGIPRLTIPCKGESGRILGTVSRQIASKDPMPRYYVRNVSLNPDSGMMLKRDEDVKGSIPVFVKGAYLYGLDDVMSKDIILVEGHLDKIAGWELGVENMAAYGTKVMSDGQAALLAPFSSVTLIPDNDALDWVFANVRVVRLSNPTLPVNIVDLSSWIDAGIKDVGDMLPYLIEHNDVELMATAVKNAMVAEVWLYHRLVTPMLDHEAIALQRFQELLDIATAPVTRVRLIAQAANDLGLPAELLMKAR